MRNEFIVGFVFTAAVSTACGSSSGHGSRNADGGSSGNRDRDASSETGGTGSSGSGGSVSSSGGNGGTGGNAASSDGAIEQPAVDGGACEPFGHFGKSGTTFTLPSGGIYYPDVQESFPKVDWANLSRLYVPAGKYKEFDLGNLPKRDPSHPLVITNLGGQVQVGPNPGANYIWSMGGGSNWILTGRYDPVSGTGDAAFPGHRCGDYSATRGMYGFLSDDAFDTTGAYLHMGMAVSAATDFEIEFTEVKRSSFAGIRLLNSRAAGDAAFDMANVRINDNYIHDTAGEGTYFGWTGDPPANLLPGLKIYNNRIIRTGNEALQIQDLGDGAEVYDNVIAFASMHWRDNGLGHYQDNNSQVQTRSGIISLHDNVFMGGASTLLSFWSQPEDGDGDRHVTFENDYFADTKSLMVYLGGTAAATSDFHFDHDFFGGMVFTYNLLDPTSADPGVVFQISPTYAAPVTLTNDVWEGTNSLVSGLTGGNGTVGTVTGIGNKNTSVPAAVFVNSGYPAGTPIQSLETWAPIATLAPGTPAITYHPGDLVMNDAEMYECIVENTNQSPSAHPEAWKKLPTPADDFRLAPGSPYAGIGVH